MYSKPPAPEKQMDYMLYRVLQQKCFYCKHELHREQWQSHWEREHHYKINRCEKCRRRNWSKVNFPGSGHDGVLKQEFSPLESTVRKVWEK